MRKNSRKLIISLRFALVAMGLFLTACQKEELRSQGQEEAKPDFTTALELSGGVDTEVIGEAVNPIELSASNEELRAASINLTRDPNNKKFKLSFDFKNGTDLPVVIACRRTEGGNKTMYVGRTSLTLLTNSSGQATRKFRIQQKNVSFYRLDDQGRRGNNSDFEGIQYNPKATYEVKLFVGAQLGEYTNPQGVKRYIINYGGNNTDNTSQLFMMDSGGTISLNGIQEKIPFVSDWSKVLFGRNKTEPGVSNNYATIVKQGLSEISLKAQGSILMFDLENVMKESNLKLQKLTIYSESLTANAAYDYKASNQDFALEPMARHKKEIKDRELYYHTSLSPNHTLGRNARKIFVFWALGLPPEYLKNEEWVTTSVVGQFEEQQGVSGKHLKYWYHMPLLKTYSRLSRLHNGRATKTTIRIEDGTPVHPMNLMAHRYVVNDRNDMTNTGWSNRIHWRDGWIDGLTFDVSIPRGNEQGNLYATGVLASYWRRKPITVLPFSQINQRNPKNFKNGHDEQYYEWRPMSLAELSALLPTGATQVEIDKTTYAGTQFIRERAALENLPMDDNFWTIYERKGTLTYAIRHLRKTSSGEYYMTPYTAAFRYDHKGGWGNGNKTSDLEIKMRPLGGTTHQYNLHDGTQGYYSKPFSEESLKKLFSIVKGESQSSVLQHDGRYWIDHPLMEDDVAREYPAMGRVANGRVDFQGEGFTIMTHNATPLETVSPDGINNMLIHRKEENYQFNWYSSGDAAPVILLARRKVLN